MNEVYVCVTGIVATQPRHSKGKENSPPVTSFRLLSKRRRYDRSIGGWVDGELLWLTVTCFRGLAQHAAKSVGKRDRVIVHGRLRVKEWGEHRNTVEIEADSIGHDLTFGTSVFTWAPRPDQDDATRDVADRMLEEVEADSAEEFGPSASVLAGRPPTADPEADGGSGAALPAPPEPAGEPSGEARGQAQPPDRDALAADELDERELDGLSEFSIEGDRPAFAAVK